MRDVRVIINDLRSIDFNNDNGVDYLGLLIDELDETPKSEKTMECLFEILENNPDIDFGSPGKIVHFLESFCKNGYEELLITSMKRHPTEHTLWMLNRAINGSDEKNRGELISLLESVCNNNSLREEIINTARDFLNYQR